MALVQIFADLLVLDQVVAEILATEPVGIPTADDAQTVADWINFLSHAAYSLSSLVFESTKRVT